MRARVFKCDGTNCKLKLGSEAYNWPKGDKAPGSWKYDGTNCKGKGQMVTGQAPSPNPDCKLLLKIGVDSPSTRLL